MKPKLSGLSTICICLWQSPLEAFVSRSSITFSSSQSQPGVLWSSSTRIYFADVFSREGSSIDEDLSGDHLDPANRFHMDMRRVLQSRKQMQEQALSISSPQSIMSLSPMERRKRPQILNEDIDGVIRVTSMLRHMVDIGVATEASFQIVLEAIGKRGRLRWVDKNKSVVCAADVVQDLIQEVWQRQDGRLSARTCNLALQAYAACATPRGNRQYAQKAQRLLNDMEDEDIEADTGSYSHVINAWAWQQGNLEEGVCAMMAQENFEKLLELSPDDETLLRAYDFMLEAWSKSPSDDAPEHAERILAAMKKLSNSGSIISILPNSQSYTNSILAWAKRRSKSSTVKAHTLLFDYVKSYESGELRKDAEPELFAFSKYVPS